MKKLLLCGVAALAVTAAAPAKAEGIDLGLGGYFIGYGLYTDQDGSDTRDFDFRKETEIQFNGETTLDNGLTVGGHIEMNADRSIDDAANNEDDNTIEESYMYVSGGWGRVNFGNEDGAAYLLQVAAPSADDNIDGLRPDINSFNVATSGVGSSDASVLNYAQDVTGYANKLTYITPLFAGFQAGASFTPSVDDEAASGDAAASDDDLAQFENAVELAARYQGVYSNVDFTLGAGYSLMQAENEGLSTTVGTDDAQAYNVGARLGYGAFGLGAAYLNDNNGVDDDGDTTTWVAGVDYVTGPFKVGVSYYDRTDEAASPLAGSPTIGGTGETDSTRWTAGVGYQYGPGMSLNGSVSHLDIENDTADADGFQVAVGTRVDF